MTNKEAKRILQFCIPSMNTDKQKEALILAIKALEDIEELKEFCKFGEAKKNDT